MSYYEERTLHRFKYFRVTEPRAGRVLGRPRTRARTTPETVSGTGDRLHGPSRSRCTAPGMGHRDLSPPVGSPSPAQPDAPPPPGAPPPERRPECTRPPGSGGPGSRDQTGACRVGRKPRAPARQCKWPKWVLRGAGTRCRHCKVTQSPLCLQGQTLWEYGASTPRPAPSGRSAGAVPGRAGLGHRLLCGSFLRRHSPLSLAWAGTPLLGQPRAGWSSSRRWSWRPLLSGVWPDARHESASHHTHQAQNPVIK